MNLDIANIKRTRTKKRKLMLWIDAETCDRIDELKPANITTQEAIRQIVNYHIASEEMLGEL